MVELATSPIGTAHGVARCCWCGRGLVVGEVLGLRCWLCPGCATRQVAKAVFRGVGTQRVCLNVPLPSQAVFEECEARQVLWGEAGPGKSHGARWWLYARSLSVPGHMALLLRETHHELETTHLRFMEREVPLLGGVFKAGPPAVAYFPATGAYIDCGHMSEPTAVRRYLGTEYGAIVAEEGASYTLTPEGVSPLGELGTRARKVYTDSRGRRVTPVLLVPSNPGGRRRSFCWTFLLTMRRISSCIPR